MDSKTTEKIRKLLAMADHPNSNENEAAVALEMAQQLLFENNLTRADVITGDSPAIPAGIGKMEGIEANGYKWKTHLLNVIAINSLCFVVRSPSENKWHLFGTYENVRAVLEMYHWIVPELERIALKAFTAYKRDGTGRERADVWRRGFYLGACKTINLKLRESLDQFGQTTGHALVPYNAELVKAAVKKVFPHLYTSRRSSSSRDGIAAGRQAGGNISLKPQRKISGVRALGSGH